MSVLGMKTKVVRSEILYDSVQEINSGAGYNAVSRTFEILPNPWIPWDPWDPWDPWIHGLLLLLLFLFCYYYCYYYMLVATGWKGAKLIFRFGCILEIPLLGNGFGRNSFPKLDYSIKPGARKWIRANCFSNFGLFYKTHC